MKTPSKPATPPTTFASPPRTAPPTARSAGLCNRPSSAMPPRADRTANSPNTRIAQAPKEMGDHPLNMSAGTFADWNSMCQNRSGRPRSIVKSAPERIAPQAATLYPVRTTGRSSGPPNQSRTTARKQAPPASPPTKKYGMMNQVQCGAPLKKVSDMGGGGSARVRGDFLHAPLAQADERQQSEDRRARGREGGAPAEGPRRQLRVRRQPVHLRLVHQQVERVEAAQRPVRLGAVQLRLHALRAELVHALVGPRAQLRDRAELDRVGRTRLGAGRLEPHLQAVVAQRAFLRRGGHGVDVYHAERAGGDTGPAAVADVRLDHDRVELRPDDGPRRAHLEAAGLDAVLAHVAHHQPAAVVGTFELLDEPDVPPVDAVEPPGVVVAVPAQLPEPAVRGRELVPFLTRDFARLAPDAHRGVGEESHGLRHIRPSPRCRRTPCLRGSTRWDHPPRR